MQVRKKFYLLALFPLAHAQDMYNSILENGCNEDGIIYNKLNDPNSHLSDGWGITTWDTFVTIWPWGRNATPSRISRTTHIAYSQANNFIMELALILNKAKPCN